MAWRVEKAKVVIDCTTGIDGVWYTTWVYNECPRLGDFDFPSLNVMRFGMRLVDA